MQVIILVGGLGTRLRSVVKDKPKPMAIIQGKPFLEYLIYELKKKGITDIIFAVGYKGEMIESHFGNGERFGVRIQYSYEKEQLGTAGAIKNAQNLIRHENFLVLNGDTFYLFDYKVLYNLNISKHALMSLVLRSVSDTSRYGSVKLLDGKLTAFQEKTKEKKEGLINGGIYCMNKRIFNFIGEGKRSLENDVIKELLRQGEDIYALVHDGYFMDIGIPKDYYRFEQDIIRLKENYEYGN